MKFQVYLSPLADYKLKRLVTFIESEWGTRSKEKFLKTFKKSIRQIGAFPNSCPESNIIKGLRRCVVTKQTSFLYRFQEEEVEIITIFDTRQNQESIFIEIIEKFK